MELVGHVEVGVVEADVHAGLLLFVGTVNGLLGGVKVTATIKKGGRGGGVNVWQAPAIARQINHNTTRQWNGT